MTLMGDSMQEQSYLIPFVSALTVVFFSMYVAFLKRGVVKRIPAELQNHRILTYQPEPLVNKEIVKDLESKILEILQPNEQVKGTYNLAKINFLNLLNNESMKKVAENCIRTYGVGSCGPRGFYGTIDVHLNLESKISKFMGLEETVLYSYGFSTVASAIGAYCKKSDIIFCDEQISFAAKQGTLAARSKVEYFKHNNMEDLELKLLKYAEAETAMKKNYRKFLIVEGIYQKTGTICPLPVLMSLREKYKLRIFIDETLSFGVLGEYGRGVTEFFNVDRTDVDMIMGSLEGSVCSIGGFCVGASVVMEHQRLSGLGYCFSASLPPYLSEIAVQAIDLFENNKIMFQKLQDVALLFHKHLRSLSNFDLISDPKSPLKVLRPVNEMKGAARKIHNYCERKNLHFIEDNETLLLYVSTELTAEDAKIIQNVLAEVSTS